MITPTTVSESFIKWMEDNGYGTFNPAGIDGDIFLNQIPDEAPDNAYWVVSYGGDVSRVMVTAQSIQRFTIQVNYRNTQGEAVEHNLFDLSQKVNTRADFSIEGFELWSIAASMPEDNDRDVENRRQGLCNIDIEIYKSYVS